MKFRYSNEEVKKVIDDCDVISFDIFDTLLLRPYYEPHDVFRHLERLNDAPGFYESRKNAEAVARQVYSEKEDICFSQIYEFIEDKYKSLKEKELDLESKILFQNQFMKEIYDYCLEKGKKVIIVSDMYLSKDFLENVLKRNGYTGFEKLFVSSEFGKMKYSGNLFRVFMHVCGNS